MGDRPQDNRAFHVGTRTVDELSELMLPENGSQRSANGFLASMQRLPLVNDKASLIAVSLSIQKRVHHFRAHCQKPTEQGSLKIMN